MGFDIALRNRESQRSTLCGYVNGHRTGSLYTEALDASYLQSLLGTYKLLSNRYEG